ncbi:hypothetical protein B1748_10130 [Paenibacillus sp. MY03]|nr:hypothetical protein B1748_10130 [Paenibacillus sp. MY03]
MPYSGQKIKCGGIFYGLSEYICPKRLFTIILGLKRAAPPRTATAVSPWDMLGAADCWTGNKREGVVQWNS